MHALNELNEVAPAFVEMAHGIVWCSAATVDPRNRPRTRILHPIWDWDGEQLSGWIATGPTPVKRTNLEHSPYMSLTYWADNHDTCTAEVRTEWAFDEQSRTELWNRFKSTPMPLGYDPAIIPGWDEPMSPGFAALQLTPWRLRVMPGSVMLAGTGEVLRWRAADH